MTPSPPPDRRAIGVVGAYIEGWRRVITAPAVWVGLLLVGLLSMVAPAVVIKGHLDENFVANGFIYVGAEGHLARALSQALPLFVDPATVFVDVARSRPLDAMTAGSLSWRFIILTFLWGGVLDRLARARPVGSAAFFAACGVYVWRFLRLAVPLGVAYWIVERWLQPYAVAEFITLVLLLIVADFARVRAVVEDRRSMLGALVASVRFVRRHFLGVIALTAINLLGITLVMMETRLEAGLAMPVWAIYLQFLVGAVLWQWARLAFAASEIVYFQHALAHAEYTAAPLPLWPDSPAAEAIENLTLVGQRAEDKGQTRSR